MGLRDWLGQRFTRHRAMEPGSMEDEAKRLGAVWIPSPAVEIPAELAAAREELHAAELAAFDARGKPRGRGSERTALQERVTQAHEAVDAAESRWEIALERLPSMGQTPEEFEEAEHLALFRAAVSAGQISYDQALEPRWRGFEALEALAAERQTAGWTGEGADMPPPELGAAAAAYQELWAAENAAERAARGGVLDLSDETQEAAAARVVRAVEAATGEDHVLTEDSRPTVAAGNDLERTTEPGLAALAAQGSPGADDELTRELTPQEREELAQRIEEYRRLDDAGAAEALVAGVEPLANLPSRDASIGVEPHQALDLDGEAARIADMSAKREAEEPAGERQVPHEQELRLGPDEHRTVAREAERPSDPAPQPAAEPPAYDGGYDLSAEPTADHDDDRRADHRMGMEL